MFKAIKEFFLGKPKVEEIAQPQLTPVVEKSIIFEPVKVEAATPVAEAVKEPEVFIDKTITDTITITSKSDIIPSTVSNLDAWPFTAPAAAPVSPVEKKPATTKKPKVVVDKKPVPAIKAGNSKTRKKK